MTENLNNQSTQPTHEALWPSDLFAQGIGWIIVSRFKSAGKRVQAGIFLLDVFCLGVKMAVFEDCDAHDYQRRIRNHYVSRFPMVAVDPSCALKVVEKGVEYAINLGFAPHSDYKKAARVFRGLSTEQCQQEFTFGYKGKPFYRRGPRETQAQAELFAAILHNRCGAGNYEYSIALGSAADINRAFGL